MPTALRATTAQKLRQRLIALGCDVFKPKRIWVGGAWDSGDLWRWQAGEKASNGKSFIGSSSSMAECLKMSDERLRLSIESGHSGRNCFYPHYDQFAAASKREQLLNES